MHYDFLSYKALMNYVFHKDFNDCLGGKVSMNKYIRVL
jgi:hypothetical protein